MDVVSTITPETYYWLMHPPRRWRLFTAAFKHERWFDAGAAIGKITIHRAKEAGDSPERPYFFTLDMLDGSGRCIEYCETFIDALQNIKATVTVPALPFFQEPEFAALVEASGVSNIRAHVLYSRAGRFMVNKRGRRRVRQNDSQESPESIKRKLEAVLRELY